MRPALVLAVCAALAFGPVARVCAADIYRWVDDDGRTHLSDKVPERYRHSAEKVDPGSTAVSPQQRKLTQQRNARIEAAAGEAAQRRSAEEAAATRPVPPAPAIGPSPTRSRSDDCAELLRRYSESQACFAPYRLANGAVRPEAFVLCGPDLPDPSGQCVQVNPD